jgi:hypothetical protein
VIPEFLKRLVSRRIRGGIFRGMRYVGESRERFVRLSDARVSYLLWERPQRRKWFVITPRSHDGIR